MGYYVEIEVSNAVIPAENLERAYAKMCALNTTHDHVKRGGSYSGGKQTAKWFSWMDENYPDTCKDARAVLDALGFYTHYDEQGNLHIDGYDSKTGQEDLFLQTIADDATGKIAWRGEDGDRWTTLFYGDRVIEGTTTAGLLA